MHQLDPADSDPDRSNLDQLIEQLFECGRPSLSEELIEGHQLLCDSCSDGKRIEVSEPKDLEDLEELISIYTGRVQNDSQQNCFSNPENVIEESRFEGRRLIQPKDADPYLAFVAELTNQAGHWLAFAQGHSYRFEKGPVLSRVLSPKTESAPYRLEILYSEPAYQEDLQRIVERGLDARFDDKASQLLERCIKVVQDLLEKDFVTDQSVSHLEIFVDGTKAVVNLEMSTGWYALHLSYQENTGRVKVTWEKTDRPKKVKKSEEEQAGQTSHSVLGDKGLVGCFEVGDLRAGYRMTLMEAGGLVLDYPDDMLEFDALQALKHDVVSELISDPLARKAGTLPGPMLLHFELPFITRTDSGPVCNWMLHCLDVEHFPMLTDGCSATVMTEGPVAYRVWRELGQEEPPSYEAIYSEEAFREELRLINDTHLHLMTDDFDQVSEILADGLRAIEDIEKRREELSCRDVKWVQVQQRGDRFILEIETLEKNYDFPIHFNEEGRTVTLILRDDWFLD